MNMFNFNLPLRKGGRNEGLIKLLSVLVEDIRVTLHRINTSSLVDVGHDVRERSEDRPSLEIFIEVPSNNDVGPNVDVKNRPDKILAVEVISAFVANTHDCIHLQR